MSSGGPFKILTNDGKADAMLMGVDILRERICRIIAQREAMPEAQTDPDFNPLPTLRDIEFTHVLHFQSKFKPFVPIGYDYQRVMNGSGNPVLNGSVTFDIPQYGEFLSDTVFNAVLSSFSCASASIGSLPSNLGVVDDAAASSYSSVNITLPDGTVLPSISNETQIVSGTSKTVLVLRRLRYQRFVDADGNTVIAATSLPDRVAYCDFPGERFVKRLAFEVSGNPLDEYDMMSYAWARKFNRQSDKYNAYCKNMGQEVAITAVSPVIADGVRAEAKFRNGPQTPKVTQPALNLWIKCLLWFSTSVDQALVSAAIPSGQRYLHLDIASSDDLVVRKPACYAEAVLYTDKWIGNTYGLTVSSGAVTLTVAHNIAPTARSTSDGCFSSTQQVLYYDVFSNGTLTPPTISSLNLYVNNIFTIPEIHDIYVARIGFSLIRIHRKHTANVSAASGEILLSQFKYPIEFFYAGLRPDTNFTGSNKYEDWHMCTSRTRTLLSNSAVKSRLVATSATNASPPVVTLSTTEGPIVITDNTYDGTDPQYSTYGVSLASSSTFQYVTDQRAIDTFGVTAHGVILYAALDSAFYNSYAPEVYGKHTLSSSDDSGALFINFCLHPMAQQPSGHVNTSRAREFYINYTSSVVSTTATATFLAEARCINFLLLADGSAVLRYTT